MPVVTLFFCGTASSRKDSESSKEYDNGELISRLGLRCLGEEGVTKLTIDGPGSGNQQEAYKLRGKLNYAKLTEGKGFGKGWDENVLFAIDCLLGRVIHEDGAWKPVAMSPQDIERMYLTTKIQWMPDERSQKCMLCEKKLTLFGSKKHHCRLCGWIVCGDCSSNVMTIKNPLSARGFQRGEFQQQRVCNDCYTKKFDDFYDERAKARAAAIDRINCIGWSRGGVTTHMFANACKTDKYLKSKEVRIIAVDPVPGGTESATHRVHIDNPNLKDYVVFYARDERTRNFSALSVTIKQNDEKVPGSNRTTYFFPGNHSTIVGNACGNEHYYKSAVLVRHLAETHLKSWNTKFEKTMQLSDHEIMQYYDSMIENVQEFKKLQMKDILTKKKGLVPLHQFGGRTMLVKSDAGTTVWFKMNQPNVDRYLNHHCFVNSHHEEVAKKLVPICVGILQGNHPTVHQRNKAWDEITTLERILCRHLAFHVRRRLGQFEVTT